MSMSLESGIIPGSLKISRVVPIPKVENASKPDQYRPVSLASNEILLMERMYYDKLDDHLEVKSGLANCQFGFRKGHSAEHALRAMTDFNRNGIDEGKICVLITIDLQKAFDSVDRSLLLNTLKLSTKSVITG